MPTQEKRERGQFKSSERERKREVEDSAGRRAGTTKVTIETGSKAELEDDLNLPTTDMVVYVQKEEEGETGE